MKPAAFACLIAASLIAIYVLMEVVTAPPGIRAICKDGTISKSKTNRGTCSSHGGVSRWTDER